MVVTQIGVGEDVVADPLRRSKAPAMADHQPDFRPEHRDMIADRLRVRRTDADVDEGDAGASLRDQMVGGHLVAPPRAGRNLRLRVGQIPALVMTAWNGERRVWTALAAKLR